MLGSFQVFFVNLMIVYAISSRFTSHVIPHPEGYALKENAQQFFMVFLIFSSHNCRSCILLFVLL